MVKVSLSKEELLLIEWWGVYAEIPRRDMHEVARSLSYKAERHLDKEHDKLKPSSNPYGYKRERF